MDTSRTILLVMGSTRAGRICPKIASWVAEIGRACTDYSYEIVDLANWWLPADDEPGLPHLGVYAQAHTAAWSENVRKASGVVFITPQFNWGYPAVLKNALDHLYQEWRKKPAAIITYGGHGGTRCAKQLRQVAAAVGMGVAATSPAIRLSEDVIRHGAPISPDYDFAQYTQAVRDVPQEVVAQIEGREAFTISIRRKWKALLAATR